MAPSAFQVPKTPVDFGDGRVRAYQAARSQITIVDAHSTPNGAGLRSRNERSTMEPVVATANDESATIASGGNFRGKDNRRA